MRNVVHAINLTLDGCCDHTKFNPDEETFEYFMRLLRDCDLLVYGRKTYQLMVPYWPDVAKNQSEKKHRTNLRKHLSPKQNCFLTIIRER